MSDERPPDLVSHLIHMNRLVWKAVSGKHTSPAVTVLLRLALVLLVLSCAGGTLWHGLLAMPTGVAVFLDLVVALRVGLWYWRRRR